jgi:RNA polymerase sigma-54 factor
VELAEDLGRVARGNRFLRVRRGGSDAEMTAATPAGLHDHVLAEIGLLVLTPPERRIAEAFVQALEPSGWLGATTEEVASHAGTTAVQAAIVLRRLQEIEPAGLFARSLAECLELQARDRGLLTEEVRAILGSLGAMADGGPAALAEASGLPVEATVAALAVLRTLDPKPGARFAAADPALLRAPDFLAVREPNGWRVELNAATLPEVEAVACPDDAAPGTLRAAREARSLAQMVARRNDTLLAVGRALVACQGAYLAMEESDPAPLLRAEVAEMAGVHESTVSRAAQSTTLQAPRGVIGLADLFSRRLPGCACSVKALRSRIRSLVASEPRSRPLSDAAIADRLAAEGIVVARRCVARHRSHLGIPARAARRTKVIRAPA